MRVRLAAQAYLAAGWSAIPVGQDKRPLFTWKEFQTRRAEPDECSAWFDKYPNANVGVVTGAISGISVVDLDGPDGEASAKDLNLPRTYTVKTPKGWHLYYKHHPLLHTGAAFLPGIDVRSDGGYVVAPPSAINGLVYSQRRKDKVAEFTLPPDALLTHSRKNPEVKYQTKSGNPPDWFSQAMRGAPEKQRNATATKLAGYLHRKGLGPHEIEVLLQSFALNCSPPMDLHELRQTISSVARYPSAGKSAVQIRTEFNP